MSEMSYEGEANGFEIFSENKLNHSIKILKWCQNIDLLGVVTDDNIFEVTFHPQFRPCKTRKLLISRLYSLNEQTKPFNGLIF